MKIDLIVETDMTPDEIAEFGQIAESRGINGIWACDYFAHWDPFVALVPLAKATSRLRLGALAVSPFEMHPLKIANGLLSLNELSGGRAQVALGPGEGNLDAMGLKTPTKIVAAIREATEIVRGAGRGDLAENGYKGEFFEVNYPCAYDWLTAPPPRVYITAYRHMMMRLAGRVADGVFIGCTPTEIIEPAMENVRTGLERRNDEFHDFKTTAYWAWHVKKDRDAAYRESRKELPWRGRKLDPELVSLFVSDADTHKVTENFDQFVQAWFEDSDDVPAVSLEVRNKLCEGFTSTGGLDEIDREIERYKKFKAAGLNEFAFRLHRDPMEALDIITEHVLPELD
jgi:alkanesulfonate monooxygenase SsuD/methylene tetrahydromethanopterin reductase-like flavin-dependent oxidoreductase (luciferase family)